MERAKDYIIWSGFSIFITNIPKEIYSAKIVLLIYKIRWQIELNFKSIKSTLKVHVIRGESDNCVACLVYAKLIAVILAFSLVSYAASICEEDKELSVDKSMKWLQDGN